ncbi:hypothetical protein [Mycobacterium sp.]|jgi:hypothetical protein|uniref:hypothetical protein n=1 Tax=Mycobacterium sp. TaxID=1785 RepID=UPI002C03EF9A|nr:hypothetical protein [Mycobacterium sp.]HTH86613.1 hypothetical protein [Mycobacterium sp.]
MNWKILAAICSAVLIIAGATVVARTSSEPGPSLSHSTATTSTTTPPSTMQRSPGYMGGY